MEDIDENSFLFILEHLLVVIFVCVFLNIFSLVKLFRKDKPRGVYRMCRSDLVLSSSRQAVDTCSQQGIRTVTVFKGMVKPQKGGGSIVVS
jgi:hypothetical protein